MYARKFGYDFLLRLSGSINLRYSVRGVMSKRKSINIISLACSKRSDSGERCEGTGERGEGTLVRILNKSTFRYTRSWYTL